MITTRQIITEYSEVRETYKITNEQAIEDLMAMKADIFQLLQQVNTGVLSGVGSPEGDIESNSSRLYADLTNSPTSVTMYFNEDIGSTTGWVEVQ